MTPPTPPPRAPSRKHLLVVDDHAAIGTSLRLMLAPEHDVTAALSAAEARALLERQEFDLVLCDLVMPGETGLDFYRQLEASHPAVAARFVFMTGGTTSPQVEDFLRHCQRPVLEKPFRPEALHALLGA